MIVNQAMSWAGWLGLLLSIGTILASIFDRHGEPLFWMMWISICAVSSVSLNWVSRWYDGKGYEE